MRARAVAAVTSRRSALLATLVSLCLLALAGPAAPRGQHVGVRGGDAIAATVADAAVAVRTLPERLTTAHRAASHHNVPMTAALPAAVLVAFLLAVRVARRRGVGNTPQSRLLATAVRGPPVTP